MWIPTPYLRILLNGSAYGFLVAITFAYTFKVTMASESQMDNEVKHNKTMKTILIWNDFFSSKHFGASLGNVTFRYCKVNTCELWDRLDEEPDLPHDVYDAILFHGIDTGNSSVEDLPLVQSPHQKYVFLLQESPIMRPVIYGFKNFFNWTATYRHDSDIYLSYVDIKASDDDGKVIWNDPTFEDMTHIPEFVQNKSKLVAWFVSNINTPSKRDVYVEELSKYIQVDVYGLGQKLTCGREEEENCDRLLDTAYKFYLSFENSLCRDYVTEKFTRALHRYVVPIVFGGADYREIAPPFSYIDVKDFGSPKHLAKYLHHLDSNPKEYLKYFWWKKLSLKHNDWYWCVLCAKLNNPTLPNRVYSDMETWWKPSSICKDPEEQFLKSFYTYFLMVYPDTEPWWISYNICPSSNQNKRIN